MFPDREGGSVITASQLRALLADALSPGDDALIHASLVRLGHFEAGVDDIVDALIESVAPNGTVIMMTDTRSFAKTARFAMNQPSETGLLTERMRQRSDVVRSRVPMVSFVAHGPKAHYYTAEYDSHLDESATISRLLEQDGKIMMMGVSYEKCTLFHLSEERNSSRYNIYKTFEGREVLDDGRELPISQKYFVRGDMSIRKDPAPAGRLLEARGLVHVSPLGDGVVRTFKARDFDRCCMDALASDPESFVIRSAVE